MKKMNRRDYLKSMGAAGVIAGAGKLDVFAQQGKKIDTSRIFGQSGASQFDLLATASVKLVFYGLMAMWQNAQGHCLVGFHSEPSTKHKHRLTIKAYKKPPDAC
ncbi:MAG TPA: hypothetical protein VF435_13185, partial [Pyrinomonadaceae bacterium]